MSTFVELLREWATSLHIPNVLQGGTNGVRITLTPIFARQLGSPDSQIGLIVGSAGIAKVFLDIVFGFAISAYGFRILMVVGLLINAAGSCVATLAVHPFHLIIASLLWGAGTGAFFLARHVFIAKAVPRNIRGRLMSILGGAVYWCSFFGPMLSGLLMDFAGVRAAALSILPLSLVCVYVILTNRKIRDVDVPGREEGERDIGRDFQDMIVALQKYWDVVIRIGVYSFNLICLRQCRDLLLTIAAMNMGLSGSGVGLVLGSTFLVEASFFFLGGYIVDTFGQKYATVPTSVNLGIAFLFLSLATNFPLLLATAVFFGLADSTGVGILLVLTADHSPPSGGPSFMGLLRMSQDLGQMVGPLACGLIIEHFGFSKVCYTLACLGIFNGIWAWFLMPKKSCSQLEEEEAIGRAATEITVVDVFDAVVVNDVASTKEIKNVVMEDKKEEVSSTVADMERSLPFEKNKN